MRNCIRVLLASVAAPTMVAAQASFGDLHAFTALRATPVGAFVPLMTPAMINRRLNGAQFGLRYGFRDEGGLREQAYAASVLVAAGLQSSMTLTAGVRDQTCSSCTPVLMLGLGGDMRLYEGGDVARGGSALTLAVSGDVGFARLNQSPFGEYAFSLGVGAPLTLSLRPGTSGMRLAPFFIPAFGIGQMSGGCAYSAFSFPEPCDKSGTRWILGGGIGVWSPASSVSVSLGAKHVSLQNANPVYGISVVVGM